MANRLNTTAPKTHEELLAREIERLANFADNIGCSETALRLEAAGNVLTHERRRRMAAISNKAKA